MGTIKTYLMPPFVAFAVVGGTYWISTLFGCVLGNYILNHYRP